MRIKLQKSEHMDDWYTIVRQEHDGREWWEDTGPNRQTLRKSERISDACVEGTAAEMIALAEGIKTTHAVSFKRCSVFFDKDGVHFCSPRNSQVDGIVTAQEALEFADQVLRELT